MTQQEKAQEVLDRLLYLPYYQHHGISEAYLRDYARKKWVGEDEPLDGDVLIAEAESRVGISLFEVMRGSKRWFVTRKRK